MRCLAQGTIYPEVIETVDSMTAHWARLPHDFLGLGSRCIINGELSMSAREEGAK